MCPPHCDSNNWCLGFLTSHIDTLHLISLPMLHLNTIMPDHHILVRRSYGNSETQMHILFNSRLGFVSISNSWYVMDNFTICYMAVDFMVITVMTDLGDTYYKPEGRVLYEVSLHARSLRAPVEGIRWLPIGSGKRYFILIVECIYTHVGY